METLFAPGPETDRLAFALTLPILLMMFYMSLRLYRSGRMARRRAAFFWMCLALAITLVRRAIPLYWDERASSAAELAGYLLETSAFLLLQLSLYQLYNVPRARQYVYFLAAAVPVGVLGFVYTAIPAWTAGTEEQIRLLQGVGFRVYLFLLLFLCYHHLPDRTGRPGLYRLSLFVFFAAQLCGMLNVYVWESAIRPLALAEQFLPVLYYGLLFMFLFERTVELLHGIYRSAITDGLTGLFNRGFVEKRLHALLLREAVVGMLFSDIDNFKRLNDTEGHDKGDEAIRQVAKIMQEEAEGAGFAGRYGGEEMVLVVTHPKTKPEQLAERIRARVEKETPVTVSIGCVRCKTGMTAEQLIKRADEAMYEAKTSGKKQSRLVSPPHVFPAGGVGLTAPAAGPRASRTVTGVNW